MAGAMRKMGVYLGLVEDADRFDDADRYDDDRRPVRAYAPTPRLRSPASPSGGRT